MNIYVLMTSATWALAICQDFCKSTSFLYTLAENFDTSSAGKGDETICANNYYSNIT